MILVVTSTRTQSQSRQHCVKNAVQRVQASGKKGVAMTNYKNCGRKRALTPQEEKMVVQYVQTWRRKLFCTCEHIKKELKLDVSRFTILRTLGRHGYHWRQVPHKGFIKPEHIAKRKEWVDKHLHCLLYTSPSPRDKRQSRMPSSA